LETVLDGRCETVSHVTENVFAGEVGEVNWVGTSSPPTSRPSAVQITIPTLTNDLNWPQTTTHTSPLSTRTADHSHHAG